MGGGFLCGMPLIRLFAVSGSMIPGTPGDQNYNYPSVIFHQDHWDKNLPVPNLYKIPLGGVYPSEAEQSLILSKRSVTWFWPSRYCSRPLTIDFLGIFGGYQFCFYIDRRTFGKGGNTGTRFRDESSVNYTGYVPPYEHLILNA